MQTERLQNTFPAEIPVPDALVQLCAWHETHGYPDGYPISGDFELYADVHNSIEMWFGSPAVVDRFGVFGAGPDGSLYAIWRQDDGRQPIVHLGSEGENNWVLATDFVEFLRLLAIGYDEIGFADLEQPPESPPNQPFARWVSQRFAVSIPATGAEITASAQVTHDDFQSWIEGQIR